MGELKEWAKSNSPFVKLDDGESLSGVYQGFKKNNFRGSEIIEYKIGEKLLSSSSGKLAMRMDGIEAGTEIKLTRFGLGFETNYEVEIIGQKDQDKAIWDAE